MHVIFIAAGRKIGERTDDDTRPVKGDYVNFEGRLYITEGVVLEYDRRGHLQVNAFLSRVSDEEFRSQLGLSPVGR